MIQRFFVSLFLLIPFVTEAQWIAPPDVAPDAYNVSHFRKTFALDKKPRSFLLKISADNRYRLYVNGQPLTTGPQRSDAAHWRYDSLDLAPYLHRGENIIGVTVWNQGQYAAWAQLSAQTGLWLRGPGIQTDNSWRVWRDTAYSAVIDELHIVGPYEQVNAAYYPWGWQHSEYNDQHWKQAVVTDDKRTLLPRNIPFPEERWQRFLSVRRADTRVSGDFVRGDAPLTIAPHQQVKILLEQGELTTAFPQLLVSGGKGSKITVTYAEALYDSTGNKRNRNQIEGKNIHGRYDVFLPDGGEERVFQPLYYRTFRYVELAVQTEDQPLTIRDVKSQFTAYPFRENAYFRSSDTALNRLWNVGWRTSRLCAYETYMDCPYYEQLQYIGDTRIQALISLYVSGDDRLMKNAILQFDQSRIADGLTQSRYPSNEKQIIPPFSLFWIAMLHDYRQIGSDTDFVRPLLPGVTAVLNWHRQYAGGQQLLGKMPYWNFVDWPAEWPWTGKEETSGIPAGALEGKSSILTLQYVYALQLAADLYRDYGYAKEALAAQTEAARIGRAVYQLCWDKDRKRLADTPDKNVFSQHANILAALTDIGPNETNFSDNRELLTNIENDSSLIQCTLYYRFYLARALQQLQAGDRYLGLLKEWYNMLDLGLTTFAERPEPTRSDCHAWSASPLYDLLATVAGITPASSGFKTVRIAPELAGLDWLDVGMPHPEGNIKLKLEKKNGSLKGSVVLPKGVNGRFYWNGKVLDLRGGTNRVDLH